MICKKLFEQKKEEIRTKNYILFEQNLIVTIFLKLLANKIPKITFNFERYATISIELTEFY